jgi:hypothetical protein
MAAKYFMVAPNIFGFSVWNLLRINLLETRYTRWPPEFWNPEIDPEGKYHAVMV